MQKQQKSAYTARSSLTGPLTLQLYFDFLTFWYILCPESRFQPGFALLGPVSCKKVRVRLASLNYFDDSNLVIMIGGCLASA